jgi:integrase
MRNAAQLSVMPKCKLKPERQSFALDQVTALLDAARGERLEGLILSGLVLGLRPGELAGLLRTDLDLDGDPATLSVTGSMKHGPDGSLYRGTVKRSTAGERTLAMPPILVAALVDHRRRQAVERLTPGPLWSDEELLFCTVVGGPLDPANLRRTFRRVATRAGYAEGVFPYLMRHTVVSLLLDGGATIEEMADLTGDNPVTLYRHDRHRVRPVASVVVERLPGVLGGRAG